MLSPRLKKTALVVAMIGSFVGLVPVSVLIVDPFFTRAYDPHWPCGVLLVWPDHVEVRWVKNISEVSPRPPGESYTFNVPPDRQAWVEQQVRSIRPQNPDAVWAIRVKQIGPERQEIKARRCGGISDNALCKRFSLGRDLAFPQALLEVPRSPTPNVWDYWHVIYI